LKNLIILALFILNIHANSQKDLNIRYFGGYSENELILPKSETYNAPVIVTEEVFSAKTSDDIDAVVEKQQKKDIADGKTAKEFLQNTKGHLYGGLSESKLKL